MTALAGPMVAGFRPQRAALKLCAAFALMASTFLSGFVMYQPAPYDLFLAVVIALWALVGLRISRRVGLLLVVLLLFDIGGMIALTTMGDLHKAPLYMAVSTFLALSAVFFASVIEDDPRRLRLIYRGYLAGALVTAMLGILGYFELIPRGEIFTRYGRAMGVFQDPNVFGPYLVLPSLYLVHSLLTCPLKTALPRLAALLVLTLGVFLSFSRAAWALYAFAVLALVLLMLIKQRTGSVRLRILVVSAVAIVVLGVALTAALHIPQVAHLFANRAHLEQSYDTAAFGRFQRHQLGFALSLTKPLGIGAEQFGYIFGEDPHNIWLKTLMAYGWLGFVAYIAVAVCTLCFGFPILLRERPWQPFLATAYITFLGHVLIGDVIDTDHWRHVYLLIGVIWGCSACEIRHQRARNPGARDNRARMAAHSRPPAQTLPGTQNSG